MARTFDGSTFPPHVLREYALLADGERGVLVGPRGDLAWMCFPRWDSPAIFAALIGGSGAYAITPTERAVWGGWYEDGTLIWHSRWVTDTGAIVECREALALPADQHHAVVLRRLTALEGRAHVEAVLDARADFGRTPLTRLTRNDDGCWHGRLGSIELRFRGPARASAQADGHRGKALLHRLELEQGERHDFVLGLSATSDDWELPDADAAWSSTETAWRERVPDFGEIHAVRDARHAYAVLAGLTSGGGGMVAAATTALPERAQQGRNYDYRYVWIRDQCITGQAVAAAGAYPLLDDAVRFVTERLLDDGADLLPVYTTTGDRVPDESHLGLPGYPGGADIVGNGAHGQFQLDIFGESLLLFAAADRHDRLDSDARRAARIAARAIEARWRETDAGIWEIEPDEWTHSNLISAAGLRALGARAPHDTHAASWLALADAIVADAGARCVHSSGRGQRSPTDDRLDAALLLPAIRGALPPDDPRSLATFEAVVRELTQDGYAYRYRPDSRPLGEAEGAFLLCGFVLALAYLQRGDLVQAARWFERNRAACGPPGLLSEEFDVTQRQLRGNLPQAFVHALLLECAVDPRWNSS
jgi:GH15 family glucan-1,4-alpha-glucosidase